MADDVAQGGGALVVIVDVEPPLLASVLGRLLEGRGWVVRPASEHGGTPPRVHALVTSGDAPHEAGHAATTFLVGDGHDRSGPADRCLRRLLDAIGRPPG